MRKRKRRLIERKNELRLKWLTQNKVNHISTTISPAPKHEDEIESIEGAIAYYHERGLVDTQNPLIIQPKYMGSYCDMYLFKNLEDSYFISRNGYKIYRVDKEELLTAAKSIHERIFSKDEELELIILQSELLPWCLMAKSLIDREFESYSQCHTDMYCYLVGGSDLSKAVRGIKATKEFKKYQLDKATNLKRDLDYPAHIQSQYDAIDSINIPDLKAYSEGMDKYQEQLSYYGDDDETTFKPFNILKKVYPDREEINESNIDSFTAISDDSYHLVYSYSPGTVKLAKSFYNELVKNGFEGVVIKPSKVYPGSDIAPMFKVRNDDYLHMIYGWNFYLDYAHYFGKRRIDKKMKCSINEWEIAQQLLRIPYKDINKDNKEFKNLFMARLREEEIEEKLDSRL